MNFGPGFFKTTSACAGLSGILGTVSLLLAIAMSFSPSDTNSHLVSLQIARSWIMLGMNFFVIAALWGIAGMKMETKAGLVISGFLFFMVDFIIEIIIQSTELFTVKYNWIAKLAEETNEAAKAVLENRISTLHDLVGALAMITFMSLIFGTFLYALATWQGKRLEKSISIMFLFSFILLLLWIFLGNIGTLGWLTTVIRWSILAIWPTLFFLIAIRLWRDGKRMT